ncbi:DUF4190 domain-containing protein [Microbacterium marinilacus]|uniref:DUF4190 domain-containing protein n=1 Tax=Microbacterium marinilacus TaxID=415209 RepID=A0ABP7B5W2_9MICO|nr:DUF4190 domain-containing protein [Microbacterium marinilacus]MBY0687564.1 hypothetical protein [Microbacterium marinilacus]
MSLPPHDGDGTPPPPPAPDGSGQPPLPPEPPLTGQAPADDDTPEFAPPTAQVPPSEPAPDLPAPPAPEYSVPPAPEYTVPPAPEFAPPPAPDFAAPQTGDPAQASFPGASPEGYPAAAPLPPYAATPQDPGTQQGYPGGPASPYGSAPYGGAPYGGSPYGGAPYGGAPSGPPSPGKGLAITALVLGIVGMLGIVVALIPFFGFIALLVPLAAIVVGLIALVRKRPGKGLAITGTVLGGVALILCALTTTLTTSAVVRFAEDSGSIMQEICDDAGLTEAECEEMQQPGGVPSDEGSEPEGSGDAPVTSTGQLAADAIVVGEAFEVELDGAVVAVTIDSVDTTTEALPGDPMGGDGEYLVLDTTWEVTSGSLATLEGYYNTTLLYGEYGMPAMPVIFFDDALAAEDVQAGDVVAGLIAYDISDADAPFVLTINDEALDDVFAGEVPLP